jgi:hypothetical protein
MTMIVAVLGPDEILAATDTLYTHVNRDEFGYTRKQWVQPAGRFIVAGSGSGDVTARWLQAVSESDCTTLENVAKFSADYLPTCWAELNAEHADVPDVSAHCMGFAAIDGMATRITFRSVRGFVPAETRDLGIYFRPGSDRAAGALAKVNIFTNAGLAKLARTVVQYNAADGDGEVPIGGDLWVSRINRDGLVYDKVGYRF